MPSLNHIHKFRLVTLGGEKIVRIDGKKKLVKTPGYEVFKCILPGCTSFFARDLALGLKTLCNNCNTEMTMMPYNLREARPHHRECRRIRQQGELFQDAID